LIVLYHSYRLRTRKIRPGDRSNYLPRIFHSAPQLGRGKLRAGYRLPAGKQVGILTDFRTKVKKKTTKK